MNDHPTNDAFPPDSACGLRGSCWSRWIGFLVILLVGVGAMAWLDRGASADLVPWQSDLPTAQRQAAESDRAMLLSFTADWCGACQSLKRAAFSKQSVAETISDRFVPVRVDMTDPDDSANAIASRYEVMYLPTLIVVDASGREMGRHVGMAEAGQLLDWLDQTGRVAAR